MLYDVEQVAIKLSVSKMTIYNKIKLKEFKDKVVKKAGKTFIDELLLNEIKDSLKTKGEVETDKVEEQSRQEVAADTTEFINLNKDFTRTLQEQIEFLKQQLSIKDQQLQMQNETFQHELQDKNKLMENMQVLLKNEQEKPKQDMLQLAEHLKEFDSKLVEVKEQMDQRKVNKGFFSKLFKGE
jgi:hypothetical protein